MCILSSSTSGKFQLAEGSVSTGVCRCQLTRIKKNVGFWIALNNFTCLQDACPWRFQVIADGCVSDQYCCSNHWEGQEITYFPYAEQVSTIYLQVSQLANPPVNIGTVSVSVMIEEDDQLSENGAQLTCGIAADTTHNFVKCGQMPDLKHEPESYVPLKKRAADDEVDLCMSKDVTQNPVTFATIVAADYGEKICNARISTVPGTYTYKYTVTQFSCSEPCVFRLMIIVGKCIKHYFCCGLNWQEATKMIENVDEDSYIRLFKFGSQPATVEFSVTVLVVDISGRMPFVRSTSGVQSPIVDKACAPAACLQVTKYIEACLPTAENRTSRKSSIGTPETKNETKNETDPYKPINVLMSIMTAGFFVGASLAMPVAKYINYMVGFDGQGPVANGLAAHVMPYATANAGSVFSYMYNTMMASAQQGFCIIHIVIIVVVGGFRGAATAAFWAVPIMYLFW